MRRIAPLLEMGAGDKQLGLNAFFVVYDGALSRLMHNKAKKPLEPKQLQRIKTKKVYIHLLILTLGAGSSWPASSFVAGGWVFMALSLPLPIFGGKRPRSQTWVLGWSFLACLFLCCWGLGLHGPASSTPSLWWWGLCSALPRDGLSLCCGLKQMRDSARLALGPDGGHVNSKLDLN